MHITSLFYSRYSNHSFTRSCQIRGKFRDKRYFELSKKPEMFAQVTVKEKPVLPGKAPLHERATVVNWHRNSQGTKIITGDQKNA